MILGDSVVAGLVIDDLLHVYQPDIEVALGELALSLQRVVSRSSSPAIGRLASG